MGWSEVPHSMHPSSMWMLLALSWVKQAISHGGMTVPPPRAENGASFSPNWYNIGCNVGCDRCSNDGINGYFSPEYFQCQVKGVDVMGGMAVELHGADVLPEDFR